MRKREAVSHGEARRMRDLANGPGSGAHSREVNAREDRVLSWAPILKI